MVIYHFQLSADEMSSFSQRYESFELVLQMDVLVVDV